MTECGAYGFVAWGTGIGGGAFVVVDDLSIGWIAIISRVAVRRWNLCGSGAKEKSLLRNIKDNSWRVLLVVFDGESLCCLQRSQVRLLFGRLEKKGVLCSSCKRPLETLSS